MSAKLFQTITNATADTNSNWIYLKPTYGKTSKFIIQTHNTALDNTDATIGIYGALSTALASSLGMKKLIGSVTTLASVGGANTFEIDNYGYTAVRVEYLKGSVTTLPTFLIYLNFDR